MTVVLLSCLARKTFAPGLHVKPTRVRTHSFVELEIDMQQQEAQHPCYVQESAEGNVLLHHHLTLQRATHPSQWVSSLFLFTSPILWVSLKLDSVH